MAALSRRKMVLCKFFTAKCGIITNKTSQTAPELSGSLTAALLELSHKAVFAGISAPFGYLLYAEGGGYEQALCQLQPAVYDVLLYAHAEYLLVGVLEARAAHVHLRSHFIHVVRNVGHGVKAASQADKAAAFVRIYL